MPEKKYKKVNKGKGLLIEIFINENCNPKSDFLLYSLSVSFSDSNLYKFIIKSEEFSTKLVSLEFFKSWIISEIKEYFNSDNFS